MDKNNSSKNNNSVNEDMLDALSSEQSADLKFYINVVRTNIVPILIIFTVALICTFTYLFYAKNIYRATTVLKIDNPKGSIFDSPFGELGDYRIERYILNQIEVLKSYYIRDLTAAAVLDSLKKVKDSKDFSYLVSRSKDNQITTLSHEQLRKNLLAMVSVNQKKGLDAIELVVESTSFAEAQLISYTYANVYVDYLKDLSRQDITAVKEFLATEKEKKYNDLNTAEARLEDFQKRTGLIVLEAQAQNLVNVISEYDAQKNASDIELKGTENGLVTLRSELNTYDPRMYDYIQGEVSKSYIEEFQRQIAEYEVKRDIENATVMDPKVKEKITTDANTRINELKSNLSQKIADLSAGVLAKTPEEKKDLTRKILEAAIQSQNLRTRSSALGGYLKKYENEFSKLPSESIELAKLQRETGSAEKLYLILEEKYQEATINERARIANAIMLDPGSDNFGPVKPKKGIILLSGVIVGLALGLAFAFTKNFLDKTIKTPDQIEIEV